MYPHKISVVEIQPYSRVESIAQALREDRINTIDLCGVFGLPAT
jgi:hypothetical protein